jgi:pyruvate ferredoxin oxidoreductase alpha subunit
MSFRIAESMDVRLPVMNCLDGFIVTHAIESLSPLDDEVVKDFVGEFKPILPLLDVKNPHSFGPFDMPEYYYEHKFQQAMAIRNAMPVIKDVFKEFEKISGRSYDFIETYRTEDAEYVAISMGSTAGTMKQVVDDLRKEGHKVGCVKVRVFRPFPYQEVAKVLEGKKAIAVLDRAISFGAVSPLFSDVRSAEFDNRSHPRTVSYIYGLGGRDVGVEDLKEVFRDMESGNAKTVNYLGVKQ